MFTAADTETALKPMPCAWLLPNANLKIATYPQLAKDIVRYVGDCVAVVVADIAVSGPGRDGADRR